jgi:large subunit ribosomal protein L4
MLEAQHFSSTAASKGSYKLPAEFDGMVNEAVLHQTIRALRNNLRQGNASTKTRGEVKGGSRKPWRQKGTGRARHGTNRSPIWRGGGIVFGPQPRDYRTKVPRKVKQAARRSAFNARAREGAVCVIEGFDFEVPKTKQMVELLAKLDLAGKKVLILTAETDLGVLRSANNIPRVNVRRYADASALDVLWADSLLIEEAALAQTTLKGVTEKTVSGRAKRVEKAAEAADSKAKDGDDA